MFVIIGRTGGYCGQVENEVIFSRDIRELEMFNTKEEAEKVIKELNLNCGIAEMR